MYVADLINAFSTHSARGAYSFGMKCLVQFVVLASLAVTPALAQPRPDDGRGYGHGWRAEGRSDRGQGQYNQGGGRVDRDNGGFGRGGRFQPEGGGRPDSGRPYGGRGYPGGNGVIYAQQPSDNRGAANVPRSGAWGGQQNEAREGVRQGRFQSMGEILGRLRQREPGQQLDADLGEGPDGRPVYRVRWAAKNGRLIDYTVDAQTGAILSEEGR